MADLARSRTHRLMVSSSAAPISAACELGTPSMASRPAAPPGLVEEQRGPRTSSVPRTRCLPDSLHFGNREIWVESTGVVDRPAAHWHLHGGHHPQYQQPAPAVADQVHRAGHLTDGFAQPRRVGIFGGGESGRPGDLRARADAGRWNPHPAAAIADATGCQSPARRARKQPSSPHHYPGRVSPPLDRASWT